MKNMLKEKWLQLKSFLVVQIKNIFAEVLTEIKAWEIKKMTFKKALNIGLFVAALFMGIYFKWKIMEILIFLIFLGIILRPVGSRVMAVPALFFLVLTPFALILKQESLAETFAIYAYYFLVMAVIMGIYEVRREKGDSIEHET